MNVTRALAPPTTRLAGTTATYVCGAKVHIDRAIIITIIIAENTNDRQTSTPTTYVFVRRSVDIVL
jgi:hypothetical protein